MKNTFLLLTLFVNSCVTKKEDPKHNLSPELENKIKSIEEDKKSPDEQEFIKNYVKQRRFESKRIVYVNGGKEDEIRTRFWLVPAGADASTID